MATVMKLWSMDHWWPAEPWLVYRSHMCTFLFCFQLKFGSDSVRWPVRTMN